MGDKHLVRFEPVGIEIEVDEDQTILRAAFRAGRPADARLQGRPVRRLQVLRPRGRLDDIELDKYSTFALPDMEREEGADAPLPRPRLRRPRDRAPQLRRGDHPVGVAAAEGHRRGAGERRRHPRHAPPGGQADRRRGHQVLPRPVHGLHRPRHRRGPVVLDGEHSRTAKACSSSSSRFTPTGRSRSSWSTRCRSATASRSRRRSARAPSARTGRRTSSSSAAAPAWRPCSASLRALAEKDGDRKARLYYGARTKADLCFEDELRALEEKIPGFKYVPALSAPRRRRLGRRRRA